MADEIWEQLPALRSLTAFIQKLHTLKEINHPLQTQMESISTIYALNAAHSLTVNVISPVS